MGKNVRGGELDPKSFKQGPADGKAPISIGCLLTVIMDELQDLSLP